MLKFIFLLYKKCLYSSKYAKYKFSQIRLFLRIVDELLIDDILQWRQLIDEFAEFEIYHKYFVYLSCKLKFIRYFQ